MFYLFIYLSMVFFWLVVLLNLSVFNSVMSLSKSMLNLNMSVFLEDWLVESYLGVMCLMVLRIAVVMWEFSWLSSFVSLKLLMIVLKYLFKSMLVVLMFLWMIFGLYCLCSYNKFFVVLIVIFFFMF